MKSGGPKFAEAETVSGTYKASLFAGLFKDRKDLLGGYPATNKGLVFPEPCLKYGGAAYTFKTNECADKVTCKHEEQEFSARYKKETGKWDLSIKQKVAPGYVALIKYEERGSGMPHYVAGFDFVKGAFSANAKLKPATGVLKGSCMYNLNDIVKGMKLAADLKANMKDLNPAVMKYNVGLSYASALGLTALALGDKGFVTVNHSLQVDKKTTGIIEVVAATKGHAPAPAPLTVGVAYQCDKNHQLRVRVNPAGQLQCCLKKDFSPNLSMLCATTVDLNKMETLMRMPAFGFKIVTKA